MYNSNTLDLSCVRQHYQPTVNARNLQKMLTEDGKLCSAIQVRRCWFGRFAAGLCTDQLVIYSCVSIKCIARARPLRLAAFGCPLTRVRLVPRLWLWIFEGVRRICSVTQINVLRFLESRCHFFGVFIVAAIAPPHSVRPYIFAHPCLPHNFLWFKQL